MTGSLRRQDSASHEPVLARYSPAERALDRYVHIAGLATAPLALLWLSLRGLQGAAGVAGAAAVVYGAGLLLMLSGSAAYNLAPPGPVKRLLRRLDHAAIFVMIAGTYTPFAVLALPPDDGLALCALVWGVAALGAGLKLAGIGLEAGIFVLLYLALGWSFVFWLRSFVAALPGDILALLLAGGILYSIGAAIHTHARWPFHNAIWHALVLAGAGLHFAAVARLFAIS